MTRSESDLPDFARLPHHEVPRWCSDMASLILEWDKGNMDGYSSGTPHDLRERMEFMAEDIRNLGATQ